MSTNENFVLCFRLWHQHEQLRLVIVRVRPTTRNPAIVSGEDKGVKPETIDITNDQDEPILDAADAGAIDEVNLAFELIREVDCLDLTKEGTDVWDATIKRQVSKQKK